MISSDKHIIKAGIFTAALFGLLLSVSHYHNETMECLEHAREQHFTENIPLCPVCLLMADPDSIEPQEFKIHVVSSEQVAEIQENIPYTSSRYLFKTKAPPALS